MQRARAAGWRKRGESESEVVAPSTKPQRLGTSVSSYIHQDNASQHCTYANCDANQLSVGISVTTTTTNDNANCSSACNFAPSSLGFGDIEGDDESYSLGLPSLLTALPRGESL
jgi:hypothetical protein